MRSASADLTGAVSLTTSAVLPLRVPTGLGLTGSHTASIALAPTGRDLLHTMDRTRDTCRCQIQLDSFTYTGEIIGMQ